MIKDKAVIQNGAGIHVRPSGVIMGELGGYSGEITLTTKKESAGLTSVISLLSLGLVKGDTVEIEVDGEDEEAVCSKTKELLERVYDFPPRN